MKKSAILFCILEILFCTVILSCASTQKKASGQLYVSDISDDFEPLDSSQKLTKLPVVKINSTKNGGKNDFVTEPVAKHVKEAQMSWHDFSNKGKPDPWYEECAISTESENGDLLLDKAAGQVKVRGNWTTNYAKKSFRIKFDKKQSMLNVHGGQKYKNWVLLACWKDASLLRDAVAFKMYNTMFPDYYASDSKLVDLYINDEYWGVYLLAEQQETKEGRVQITEPGKNYTGTDIGYFIEFDSYYYTEVQNEQFTIQYQDVKDFSGIKGYDGKRITTELQRGYTIKSDVYDAAQKEFIQKYMNNLWKICYSAAYNNKYYRFTQEYELEEYTPQGNDNNQKCKNCVSEIFDLKSLADMYIFNEIVCDPDIYLTSFFMDIDFSETGDKLLHFEAPWDFDSTMGNKRHCSDAQGMFAGKTSYDVNYNRTGTGNPWMFIFINCDWFKQLVKKEWSAAKETNPLRAAEYVIQSYEGCSQNFMLNRNRWGNPSDDDELCPASKEAAANSQKESVDYLRKWLKERIRVVDALIYGL